MCNTKKRRNRALIQDLKWNAQCEFFLKEKKKTHFATHALLAKKLGVREGSQ